MIQRIVFIKLTSPKNISTVIEETKKVIPTVPGVKNMQVGSLVNCEDFDISLSMIFDNMAAVEEFGPNQVHRKYVDEFLKPQLSGIKAYNIEIC